ncbi:DUF4126 domain-containing protein [Nonlabens ponticola]|uniref:DUF4126 domain-containing protein n=1 Tax=Nonlabens ponticola TaxID=2496866 RepID=A0A3S9MZX1_9FLAO|nr:DUF4126 domain-containing protein [Nonlabens ponticola]AZQ44623.1 DUF4126 domain-containing protein [Nonlabens ponticola]
MWEIIASVLLGIGLSASAGFRVFVPLLLLSIASYVGWIPLNESWQWAGSLTAITLLSVASVIEIAAYFIPVVDNLLDSITIPLATIAGTLVMVSVVTDLDPIYSWTLAIIAGGGTAATIASSTGATRAASTTATAGIANPIINVVEVVFSLVLSFLSIFAPVIAFILVVLLILGIRKLYKKMFKRSQLSRKHNHNKPTTTS